MMFNTEQNVIVTLFVILMARKYEMHMLSLFTGYKNLHNIQGKTDVFFGIFTLI